MIAETSSRLKNCVKALALANRPELASIRSLCESAELRTDPKKLQSFANRLRALAFVYFSGSVDNDLMALKPLLPSPDAYVK